MLNRIISHGLDLYAFVTPISIAATNIAFLPLAALWLFGGRKVHARWPAIWGLPEKLFLVFLGISLVSALCGLDPRHSLKEIKNKDLYILITIVLVALVRDEEKNARLIRIFMLAGTLTAVWGLLQCVVGVNQSDKSNGIFYHLPKALAHWPRPVLDLLSLINGRVMGTRGHPLAFAECLLFNWAFASCFVLSSRGKQWVQWLACMIFIGTAILVSQSRGPWIACAVILFLAMVTSGSRRTWLLLGMVAFFLGLLSTVPVLRDRAVSIADSKHHSNSERVHMWHAGWMLWKTHPLLGIGPGNVKQVSVNFQNADERPFGPWGHLHSTYVNTLAERGILGLVSFLIFIGAFVWEIWVAMRRSLQDPYKTTVYKATLLGILGFLIGGVTETAYNTAVVKMTLFFVVGLALALSRHEQSVDH